VALPQFIGNRKTSCYYYCDYYFLAIIINIFMLSYDLLSLVEGFLLIIKGVDEGDLITSLYFNWNTTTNTMMFIFWLCRRTGRAGRHGYAYTFISSSQGKYAGEIIKALELSSALISDELTQLWEKYKQEAEAVMSLRFFELLRP